MAPPEGGGGGAFAPKCPILDPPLIQYYCFVLFLLFFPYCMYCTIMFYIMLCSSIIMEFPPYGILLNDVQGFKQGPRYGQQLEHTTVQKGSLISITVSSDITALREAHNLTVNYQLDVHSFSTTYLYANFDDIFGLSSLQRDLMFGVKDLDDRLSMLSTLMWVESVLEIRSAVYVAISSIPTPVRGVVRYIGELPCEYGRNFGIELLVCMC